MSALAVQGLSVRYGLIQALRPISFEIGLGESLAIIGPNGAGKSSLLQAIANVVPHATGTCSIQGSSTRGIPPERLARRGLAVVPERRRIFGNLSVRENLVVGGAACGAYRSGALRSNRAVDDVLDRFPELKPHLRKPAQTLSGGQQQMLAIARALISKPSVLLLDEPSLGLAPVIVDRVFQHLQELRQETDIAMILVEQNAVRAIEFADRSMVLRSGSVVLEGGREDLLARPNLANDFLGHGTLE